MLFDRVQESIEFIQSRITQKPTIGIILGSGLGGLVDIMENKETVPYSEIPGFPKSNVVGHAAMLVIGKIGSHTVAAMQGRFHYYEGFTMQEVTYPLYVLQGLGVKDLIVTNACGAVNRDFAPGDLILLSDYINLTGHNPLIGANDERFGPRFPDMSDAYAKELREFAGRVAEDLGFEHKEGVYALFTGPCYETAAEIRACAVYGADLVGMSTVPETIVANYLGMRVLGIGCVTNMATGIATVKHSHEAVLKIANEASEKLCGWVAEILRRWEH
ncbi:MAG: purine-nucleoside phosphorylase [Eubacteriales bacterium]|nr:purine-nucleoside phosphorylase [Eubacteriales bacterium]